MVGPTAWKSRPVFIASTFQDMQDERDHLRTYVFPRLEEALREHRQHLEWIDLRLGVPTASIESEDERELKVLKVCLDEVERSRPYIIALIGDRYGWTPPFDRIEAVAREKGMTCDLNGRSVTDLEIEFGLVADTAHQRRGFCYTREPLDYAAMGDLAGRYSDAFAKDTQAPLRMERLNTLRARIRSEFGDRVRPYTARWDGGEHLVDLEEFGERVAQDILDEIRDEALHVAQPEAGSWEEAERLALFDFVEHRTRGFVGRAALLEELDAFLRSDDGQYVDRVRCVADDAGSGKSALFGMLLKRWSHEDALVLAHAAGSSPLAESVSSMLRRWCGELAGFLSVETGLDQGSTTHEIDNRFSELLRAAAKRARVVMLIDALDQFEATTRARYLTWLPKFLFENVRLVSTGIPGPASETLASRKIGSVIPMPPLDRSEARQIVATVSLHYRRTLEHEVIEALLNKVSEKAAAFENPLWLRVAVEELHLIDADDFGRAERSPEAGIREDRRLVAMLLDTIAALPTDITSLAENVYDRAEALFGPLARAFVAALAASRGGWRAVDLESILPNLSGEDWNPLRFATLRRSFRSLLRCHGTVQRWDFAHGQLRIAASRWINGEGRIPLIQAHSAIADHLVRLDPNDPLHIFETMVHLLQTEDWPSRAVAYLGDEQLSDIEENGAVPVLAAALMDQRSCSDRLEGMLGRSNAPDKTLVAAARRSLGAMEHLSRSASLQEQLASLSPILKVLEEPRTVDDDAQRNAALAEAMELVAEIYAALGDPMGAVDRVQRSIRITEQLKELDDNALHLSRRMRRLANYLRTMGRTKDAVETQQAAVEVAKRWAAANSRDPAQENLCEAYGALGQTTLEAGNLELASEWLQHGLNIATELSNAQPENIGRLWRRGESEGRMGALLLRRGNAGSAYFHYDAHHSIMERLVSGDPTQPRFREGLGRACFGMGEILEAKNYHLDAARFLQEGIELLQQAVKEDPDNAPLQKTLNSGLFKLGEQARARFQFDVAENAFKACVTGQERLVSGSPDDLSLRAKLQSYRVQLAAILTRKGDLVAAEACQHAALAGAQELSAADPADPALRQLIAAGLMVGGEIHTRRRDAARAVVGFREAAALLAKLKEEDPANSSVRSDLAQSLEGLGLAYSACGRHDLALQSHEESFDLRDRLMRANPIKIDWVQAVGTSILRIGEVYKAKGDATRALDAFQGSREFIARAQRMAPWNPELIQLLEQLNGELVALDPTDTALARAPTLEEMTAQSNREQRLREAVTAALARDAPAEALALVQRDGSGKPQHRAMEGVCQMRLGKPELAVQIFGSLVAGPDGRIIPNMGVIWVANYALAHILCGNVRVARDILQDVREPNHPSIVRLREAINKWEGSRRGFGRFFGRRRSGSVALGFPLGEI